MRTSFVLSAALLALAGTASAEAATVVFGNITGTWFDGVLADGSAPTGFVGNGTSNAQVRWGQPAETQQSGYGFVAAVDPTIVVNPPAGSGTVVIGTFSHFNFPIFPPSADTIRLRLTSDVTVDNVSVGQVDFIYDFDHSETTNAADPCDFGGANGQGLNINGCADNVAASFSNQSGSFFIGTDRYTLDVLGFRVGNTPVTNFTTIERQVNTAELIGRVTLFSAAVPEPTSWAMLIAGFGLVGASQRRRRAFGAAAA